MAEVANSLDLVETRDANNLAILFLSFLVVKTIFINISVCLMPMAIGLGYVEETLEELSSSNLLSKRKRPKLEISTGKSVLEDLEVVSRESSPDNEMLPDLAVSRCLICSRYITIHSYSLTCKSARCAWC